MNLDQYQALALRTEAPQPTPLARLEHAALGLISEPGEIATQIKRIAFYGKTLDSLDKDDKSLRMHIAEEIGDTMWYMAIAGDVIGYDVFEAMAGTPARSDITLKSAMFRLGRAAGKLAYLIDLADGSEGANKLAGSDFRVVGDYLDMMVGPLVDMAAIIGISIDEIAAQNIAKLQLRYPDKFTAEAAEARADKGGLDARNS